MRRGCRTPFGRSAWGRSGGPKQKTSVFMMGLAPSPVPSGSRIKPPRPGAAPGARRVADRPAEPRRRPAVRLPRRGVIMRLDLEADRVPPVEVDYTRVVLKDGQSPGFVQFAGDLHHRALHQII